MRPVTFRHVGAVVAASIQLATLAVVVVAAPSTAAPTCDGRPATIVGTNRRDVINGTSGPDVIVSKGGPDRVNGRGGRDRICGGGGKDAIDGGRGNDRIFGGSGNDGIAGRAGHDDIFGFDGHDIISGQAGADFVSGGKGDDLLFGSAGPDVVLGGAGDDDIDGGADSDECDQGPGNGDVQDCETADLSVDVQAPDNANKGPTPFTATVQNLGPDGVTYTLAVNERDIGGTGGCEVANEGVAVRQPLLGSGAQRVHEFILQCSAGPGNGGSNEVSAIVDADGTDPQPGNDESSSEISWN